MKPFVFQVSIAILIFVPVYMQLFLVETVRQAPRQDQHSTGCTMIFKVLQERCISMKQAGTLVLRRYIC